MPASLPGRGHGRRGWGVWLPGPGGALDRGPGPCPLTYTMPVPRHGLHRAPGERELLRAGVPEPTVRASRQTYARRGPACGGRVRFSAGGYRGDLEFDADGFVVDHPAMARRPAPGQSVPPGGGVPGAGVPVAG